MQKPNADNQLELRTLSTEISRTFSPEFNLLTRTCMPHARASTDEVLNLIRESNPRTFLSLVDHHRVWPSVYQSLNKKFRNEIDSTLLTTLEKSFLQNVLQIQLQQQQIQTIHAKFESAGIPIASLKGPSLGRRLFEDPNLRYSSDIDFLIQLDDINRAHAILADLDILSPQFHRLSSGKRLQFFKGQKDVTYRTRNGVKIELHTRLSNYHLPLLDWCENCMFQKGPEEEMRTAELLYLCWHGTNCLFFRLKWAIDVALFLEQVDGKPAFLSLLLQNAHKNDGFSILSASWMLCNILFGTYIPEEVEKCTHNDQRSQTMLRLFLMKILKPIDPNSMAFYLDTLKAQSMMTRLRWGGIKAFLRSFRPTQSDFYAFPWVPQSMYFLYYLLRPLRTLKRMKTKPGGQ